MQRIGRWEITPNAGMDVVHACNKMHVNYRVQVEWRIGGLKRKWGRLMKRFDVTKPRHSQLFKYGALLTNFLHRRRMDLTYEVISDHLPNLENRRWARDF
jgi:hypothetical protein